MICVVCQKEIINYSDSPSSANRTMHYACYSYSEQFKKDDGFVQVKKEDLERWKAILLINEYSFRIHTEIAKEMKKYLSEKKHD